MKILIDNGHGIETPGKRSPDGRLLEYRYTREIAAAVVSGLRQRGLDAIRLVPEEPISPSKKESAGQTPTDPMQFSFPSTAMPQERETNGDSRKAGRHIPPSERPMQICWPVNSTKRPKPTSQSAESARISPMEMPILRHLFISSVIPSCRLPSPRTS